MILILQSSSVMRLTAGSEDLAREHGAEYLHGILPKAIQLPPKLIHANNIKRVIGVRILSFVRQNI